jgi:eukaryotic-like serine/threonine-protein kinase
MPLTSGTFIGPYEITAAIGAGGMGEVYRARDARLQRDVAIKVLPDLFAQDPDRLARFEREAKMLAALNHPNIAQIHGVIDTPAALVMEFVGGDDLQQRLAAGPVPVDEALPIARQIAEALEAAHERAIVHRDLKPANIKIAPDGSVKVLDFGLARALDAESGPASSGIDSPTFTSPAMTRMGVILGTAAYMSPEQARGRTVDRRADIWAFGCVLFEMLTGRSVFGGDTVTDTLAAIVSGEPQWSLLPAETPQTVRHLLRRCLDKDPRRRLQAIGEARIVLDAPVAAMDRGVERSPTRLGALTGTVLVIAGIAAGAVATMRLERRQTPRVPPAAHLAVPLAPAQGLAGGFSLSPDGRKLAYVGIAAGRSQLFVRSLERDDAVSVAVPDALGTTAPVFSPDGKWVVFSGAGVLKKVAVDGGVSVTVSTTAATANTRPAWGPDDTIVFSNGSLGLSRVSAAGGQPQVVTTVDTKTEMAHEMPLFLPGTRTLLFDIRRTAAATNRGATMIVAHGLDTGDRRELFPGMVLGFISPDRLVVQRDDRIVTIPFDSTRLVATGDPTPLLPELPTLPATQRLMFSNVPLFAVAPNGTTVFQRAQGDEDDTPLVIVDRSGTASPITLPPHRYSDPRVSPDGKRIVVHLFEEARDNWVADLRRGTLMRLTFDPGEDETPVWSSDGKWIFWTASRAGLNRAIYRRAADGTGPEQLIWSGNNHLHIGGITPDTQTLIVSMIEGQVRHLDAIAVANGKVSPLVRSQFGLNNPALSPDGKWLAYMSDESGQDEIYVQPFPSLDSRVQVSAAGGAQPVWARTGHELFYRSRGKFMSVEFSADDRFTPSTSRVLFADKYFSTQGVGHTSYDVTPDGRFVMVDNPKTTEGAITHLSIIYRP